MPDNRTDPPDPAQASERPESQPGNTTPAQGEDQRTVPRMPHERDESADSQPSSNASQARVGRKASADVERGVADTTKGAELDATYDKLREDLPDGEKKYRP